MGGVLRCDPVPQIVSSNWSFGALQRALIAGCASQILNPALARALLAKCAQLLPRSSPQVSHERVKREAAFASVAIFHAHTHTHTHTTETKVSFHSL